MRTNIIIPILIVSLFSCGIEKSNVDYINPMIGAVTYSEKTGDVHGFGKTFPGATTPFGLVQLSPDTRTGGDNGCGYSWGHKTIEGFSFTHMSGVGWYGDLGNFLVMPTTGKMHTNKGTDSLPEQGYRSRYSHDNEIAEAGYYSVILSDYDIKAELSAAPRAGILRFTFPENENSRIQIDLSRRVGGTSTEQYIKIEDSHTISGWMKCPPEGGGWGNGGGKGDYTVYFYCQFNKPFTDRAVLKAILISRVGLFPMIFQDYRTLWVEGILFNKNYLDFLKTPPMIFSGTTIITTPMNLSITSLSCLMKLVYLNKHKSGPGTFAMPLMEQMPSVYVEMRMLVRCRPGMF